MWGRAKAFSNGIQPDVPGDGIRGHWFAQDVIIIVRLPKAAANFLLIVKGGLLFEQRNESDEITSVDHALHQEVNVVRHYAIGVNDETLFGGSLQQFCD